MANAILEVKHLQTQFKTKKGLITAVDDVGFVVYKGETLGIVGESGCGKSVTSMSILRLLPRATSRISSGEVLLNGEDLLKKSEREMRRVRGKEVSMIFQDPMAALDPVIPVGKQLAEAITVHERMGKKETWQRATELLRKVGIPSPELRMREYPHQLSGGMRQRVMIAMAMSSDVSLLIADEPTTALDVTIQAQILELMRKLQKEAGTSIMLITHDMGVVAEMADHVLVMYAGKTVEYSTVQELFSHPLHPYTKGLLASIPRPEAAADKELYAVPGAVPTLDEMPLGCRFCTRCPEADTRCAAQEPPLFNVGERQVRCWKYQKEAQI